MQINPKTMDEIYQTQITNSVESLFSYLSERATAEEVARMRRAYELAAEAHKEQKRKSGEPFIMHPIAVAGIVARELELGDNPVISAFLHDVVEDTDYTVEDIRERFGDDVAFLVDTVTKRKKDSYEQSKQIDNYRQILESVHYDIRALLIKLVADSSKKASLFSLINCTTFCESADEMYGLCTRTGVLMPDAV